MCSLHLSNDKPMTKLTILQEAVNVITALEQQVRGTDTSGHIHHDANRLPGFLLWFPNFVLNLDDYSLHIGLIWHLNSSILFM
jgi:hypothetical protein